MKNMFSKVLVLIALLPLASCITTNKGSAAAYLAGIGRAPAPIADGPAWNTYSYWDDDKSAGSPHIVVNLDEQMAKFYRGDTLVGVAGISSGSEMHRTPSGNYKILEKKVDKHSNLYGHIEDAYGRVINDDATPQTPVPPGARYVPAPMPYWMRLTNSGIGMHQGFLPGYAASHGCIRVDKKVIRDFYNAAYVGMPVKVINTF